MEDMVAQARVKWIGEGEFVGTDSTKHSLIMSSQDEENATGLKPSELLLIALGGCTGLDVVSILKKRRQTLTGLEINVTGEQDPDPPWAFRKIRLEYALRGTELSEPAIERAIKLSEEKYCSVGATVSGMAEVTSSFTIVRDKT
ncbi:MAG: osmotically inducible protein OsmC [Chloroflexi bacterium B3_Chlor]|nr:MAG: osmotically inducible protein OsmC [Chloroflexi bacterium B3_Chlor]